MRLQFLSPSEVERILGASLRVLQKVGSLVQDEQARQLLADAGAHLQGERVLLPEQLVLDALEKAPRSVRLAGRNGDAMDLGGASHYFTTGSDGQQYLDAASGRCQPGTLDDLVRLTRVADALPGLAAVNLQIIPSEHHGNTAQLLGIAAVLANTRKHQLAVPLSCDLARAWVDMVGIADPGLDLRANPVLSCVAVTLSPLVLDAENCGKLLFFAEQGLPVLTMPCPMAGASSPFTLAGTLVTATAEALLELVLVQCCRAGSPVVLGSALTIMDMATATVTYAAPEFSLLCGAFTQIAQHLHLPAYVPLAHPDAELLDEQCAAEKASSFLSILASGAHLFGGAGSLGKTAIVSCEQLVIDNELYLWTERFFHGVDVSEEALAEETIAQVGPGGSYLATRHTLRFLNRGEHWRPQVSNRRLPGSGAPAMLEMARQRVQEILERAGPVLPEGAIADLNRYALEQGRVLDR